MIFKHHITRVAAALAVGAVMAAVAVPSDAGSLKPKDKPILVEAGDGATTGTVTGTGSTKKPPGRIDLTRNGDGKNKLSRACRKALERNTENHVTSVPPECVIAVPAG